MRAKYIFSGRLVMTKIFLWLSYIDAYKAEEEHPFIGKTEQ